MKGGSEIRMRVDPEEPFIVDRPDMYAGIAFLEEQERNDQPDRERTREGCDGQWHDQRFVLQDTRNHNHRDHIESHHQDKGTGRPVVPLPSAGTPVAYRPLTRNDRRNRRGVAAHRTSGPRVPGVNCGLVEQGPHE